ncbi:MAG: ACP S-malonyltransferase [Spirochaetales bacterium]|nr:ACP S-malonyltransferase [Spirochaetales bacterium]
MITVYVFPGQGSQSVGMGKASFDDYPDLVAKADAILGYSLKTLCLEDPEGNLNLTQYTQPALFAVTALEYLKLQGESAKKPDYLAGHSLGEYAALFAASAFDFETGIRLVQKRGELMGKARGGGMVAVIGLDRERVHAILKDTGMDTVEVANYNSPGQTILSGPVDDLNAIAGAFEEGGARRYLPLKVSAAFHSRYMAEAGRAFSEFLQGINFENPKIPVISNVTAGPYKEREIRENLVNQLTSSVRWQESIEYLLAQGECEFKEIGPGTVLTKLIEQIRQTV